MKSAARGRSRFALISVPFVRSRVLCGNIRRACPATEHGAPHTDGGDEQIDQSEIDKFPELSRRRTGFAHGAINLLFAAHVDDVVPQGKRVNAVEEKVQVPPPRKLRCNIWALPTTSNLPGAG